MNKKENVLEKCRINLDKEKVLHSITRGERDKYKEKIDKAIEHLEESINFYLKSDEEKVISIDSVKERYLKPVLEILKGE